VNATTRPTRAPAPNMTAEGNRQLQTLTPEQAQRNQLPHHGVGQTQHIVTAPAAPASKPYPPKIAKAILQVTRNINPVAKAGYNDFHKYAYRKFEDVFAELVPALNDAGLIIQQSEINLGNLQDQMISITYDFTIINEDGDVWPDRPQITAICKAVDNKGVRDDKAASKCNTQAQKYFYTSFFKIRTADVSEADADAAPKQQKRRAVPSPDGKVGPHTIAIVNGEAPKDWAVRFKKFVAKAATVEEVDAWYNENLAVFKRLEEKEDYKPVLDELIDAMDARALVIGAPKQTRQEIISHPDNGVSEDADRAKQAREGNGGFPGDTPMRTAPDTDIPLQLDRRLTEQERDWLTQLDEAYQQCNNAAELAAEQESIMLPAQETVSKIAWDHAKSLTTLHLNRVQQ